MPPPTTATQRIAFLSACQRSFSEVMSTPPATTTLRVLQDDALTPAHEILPLARASAHPRCVGSRAEFRCVCCASRERVTEQSAAMGNPFSDLLVLRCAACKEASATA